MDAALGIEATGSWTRVDTFVLHTRSVEGALRVKSTLGSTIGWTAEEVGNTRADGLIVAFATLGIRATGRGLAGIQGSC